MPARVADASVLGALAFHEARAQEALALIAGAELNEPHLLAYELTSVARKKALLRPRELDSVLRGLGVALAMRFRWVEVDHEAVLRLALERGLTTYDASYLYVARRLGIPLVTFDRELRTAAER